MGVRLYNLVNQSPAGCRVKSFFKMLAMFFTVHYSLDIFLYMYPFIYLYGLELECPTQYVAIFMQVVLGYQVIAHTAKGFLMSFVIAVVVEKTSKLQKQVSDAESSDQDRNSMVQTIEDMTESEMEQINKVNGQSSFVFQNKRGNDSIKIFTRERMLDSMVNDMSFTQLDANRSSEISQKIKTVNKLLIYELID